MNELGSGTYVVAVSGGIDSVVLLDKLCSMSGFKLVVAHYDHGIRPNSADDCAFVHDLAQSYGLICFSEDGHLGHHISEALAREKRYDFLRRIRDETNALAIITAHHKDDLMETAIINILRGTGRRGLSSLRSTKDIKRPLLNVTKNELIDYAKSHQLEWREDSTNSDSTYLRNYVRQRIIANFSDDDRRHLLDILKSAEEANRMADCIIERVLTTWPIGRLDRQWFQQLPHNVAIDIFLAWIYKQGIRNVNRRLLEELVVSSKTLSVNKSRDINAEYVLKIGKKWLALEPRER